MERLLPPHVTLSLIGRFKKEEGEKKHFLPVVAVTGVSIEADKVDGVLIGREKGVRSDQGVYVPQSRRQGC
jgi:hypothetical protein